MVSNCFWMNICDRVPIWGFHLADDNSGNYHKSHKLRAKESSDSAPITVKFGSDQHSGSLKLSTDMSFSTCILRGWTIEIEVTGMQEGERHTKLVWEGNPGYQAEMLPSIFTLSWVVRSAWQASSRVRQAN